MKMKVMTLVVLITLGALLIAGGIGFFVANQYASNDGASDNQNVIPESNNSEATNSPNETQTTAKNYNVEIKSFSFSPSTLTIKVGDTVIWTNNDPFGHTITSDSGTELMSDTFGQGKTFSHTFNTAGTYKYHCSPHPSMKGTIIVSADT